MLSYRGYPQEKVVKSKDKSETYFLENKGQVIDQHGNLNNDVLYLLNTPGLNVQFRKGGFSYDLYMDKKNDKGENNLQPLKKNESVKNPLKKSHSRNIHRIDFDFIDINKNSEIVPEHASPNYVNYYNVSNKPDGVTKVNSYRKIVYKNLYDNIDLEFVIPDTKANPVKYNFIISPGGNVLDIKFKISGTKVNIQNGSLCIETRFGNLYEMIPESWIGVKSEKKNIEFEYESRGNNVFGYKTVKKFDKEQSTLTIDPTPVRLWATYFGGEKDETQYDNDIETDSEGNVYVSGYTRSLTNIATTGSYQSTYSNNTGSWVGYLAKFSTDGELLWSTYYGNRSFFRGMTTTESGEIIAVGETYKSTNIATQNSHQPDLFDDPENYFDGLIVKFRKDGTRIWSTYYGGESFDYCMGITTDSQQNLIITGSTASNKNIATSGAFWENPNLDVHNNWSPFILKMGKDGKRLWSTYYGGEYGIAVDVDSKDNIYFTGSASRSDNDDENVATPGSYQEQYSDENDMSWSDIFLAKFNPNGERIWGTYFGGDSYDDVLGLVVDHADNIIIAGSTRSNSFPTTTGAHRTEKIGAYYSYDAFLAKFNADGNLLWNTLFGGNDSDSGTNVNVDLSDNIFLVGDSRSLNGISTPGSFQESVPNPSNPAEAFITKFDSFGNQIWGTYYGGGDFWEQALDATITQKGEIYLLGFTFGSPNLATPGAFQENYKGEIDNFIVKFKDCTSSMQATVSENLCEGEDIQFTAEGGESYSWTGPNNFTSTSQNPEIKNITNAYSGQYVLYAESEDGCDNKFTFDIVISKKPIANNVEPLFACEDSYGSGISNFFDTSEIESKILSGQTGMKVLYFDSNGVEMKNPLPNFISNESTDKIVARVFPANNENCFAETIIELVAGKLPINEEIISLVKCGENEDGFANFNLKDLEYELEENYGPLNMNFFDSNNLEIPEQDLSNYQNQIPQRELLSVSIEKVNGCNITKNFELIVRPSPKTESSDDLTGCDDNNDGISELFDTSRIAENVLGNQENVTLSFFNSYNVEMSELPNPYTNLKKNEDYFIVRLTDDISGCYSEKKIILKTSVKPAINQPIDLYACDEGNGFSNFNTEDVVENIIGIQNNLNVTFYNSKGEKLDDFNKGTFRNLEPFNQNITAKIENINNKSCFTEAYFNLKTLSPPEMPIEDSYRICFTGESVTLQSSEKYLSTWFDPDGNIFSNSSSVFISEKGTYALSIIKEENGILCESFKEFEIFHSEAPLIEKINYNDFAEYSTVEIIASGDGDFEYSLDGTNFQDENLFKNIEGGEYKIIVRDKYGCGVSTQIINIINYSRYFTPNGDGYHDIWNIKGISNQTGYSVLIYDRYGKLLVQLDPNSNGWDGNFNGRKMPSNDYWFQVEFENGKIYSGHFSLIR